MRKPLIGLLGAVVLVSMSPAAHAAFPGLNGKIAFYTQQGTSDDIWVMELNGAGQTAITDVAQHERDPAWSPDGTKIALVRAGSDNEIYVMNADGSGLVNISNFSGSDLSPAWSPDGTKIAFSTNRVGDVGTKIYVMDADGSDVTRLTDGFGITDNKPAWSPDGQYIAFFRVNDSQIYRMKADGSDVTPITSGGGVQDDPNWSPSGHRIAYSRSGPTPATTGVHTMDPDGSNDVDLSSALTEAHDPAWSPDGSKIVMSRNGHVWTMNANGSGPTQLTTVFGTNGTPDWQPLTYPGYPRPKGATPIRVALVPAYAQCSAPDRTHGPPLTFGSCHSPSQISPNLTVGTPDAGGGAANSIGSVLITAKAGAPGPPDDSGAPINLSLTDVRCGAALPTCGAANAAGGADYTGELQVEVEVRMTDKFNGSGGPTFADSGTMEDFTFRFSTSACAGTASTAEGATCSFNTDVLYVIPGVAKDGKRQIWELGQVRVLDGGPDGDADTLDNSVFAVQGLFVP